MYYENRKKFEKEIKIFEEFEKNRKLLSWEETFEAVFHYKSLLDIRVYIPANIS